MGGGATFGGVAGCNGSVCSEEYRASVDAINALRIADQASKGPIDEQQAAAAVLALPELADRSGAISPDAALGVAAMMVDNGELRQLISGYGKWAEKSPAARLDALNDFLQTQTSAQQTDNVQQQITLKHAVENMSEEERLAFAAAVADYQLQQGL